MIIREYFNDTLRFSKAKSLLLFVPYNELYYSRTHATHGLTLLNLSRTHASHATHATQPAQPTRYTHTHTHTHTHI